MTTTTPKAEIPGTVPTVWQAWNAVMAAVQSVGKYSTNTEQHYRFRGIDAVMNAVGPKLREHGVSVHPVSVEPSWRDVLTTREKRARECTVRVVYRVTGPAGDSFDVASVGESLDSGDKGTAKAMSVAYRVMLLQSLTIPTDEPDPDASSYERAEGAPQKPQATAEQITDLQKALYEVGLLTGAEAGQEVAAFLNRQVLGWHDITPDEATRATQHFQSLAPKGGEQA